MKRLFDNHLHYTAADQPRQLPTAEPSEPRYRQLYRNERLIPWLITKLTAREERYVCYPDCLVSLL